MATAAALSFNVKTSGVTTVVPNNDIARLMYYLHCITVALDLDILADDLVAYEQYQRLSSDRTVAVVKCARTLNPDEIMNKLIFRDDKGHFTGNSLNKFVNISAACDIVSLDKNILIAGKVQKATKVMFFESPWLRQYYTEPMARINAKHQCKCDGCNTWYFAGPRYKCAICANYDLCSSCYQKDIHYLTHGFKKYEKPGSLPISLPPRRNWISSPAPARRVVSSTALTYSYSSSTRGAGTSNLTSYTFHAPSPPSPPREYPSIAYFAPSRPERKFFWNF